MVGDGSGGYPDVAAPPFPPWEALSAVATSRLSAAWIVRSVLT